MTTVRNIAAKVEIDWDFDGTETDESDSIISARGQMAYAAPGESILGGGSIVSRASVELKNNEGRYSVMKSAGPLYADIAGGQMYKMPIIVWASIDGGSNYFEIFTGVMKIPNNGTVSPKVIRKLPLDCRGNEERILNHRTSTPRTDFVAYHDDGMTEADLIYDVLVNQVGLNPSEVVIDDGLTIIPWFWAEDASPIEVCWKLAQAAGGRFYCRHDGRFTYENATHWLLNSRSTISQQTYERADLADFSLYYSDTELASKVIANATLYELQPSEELWSAKEVITLAPGESTTIIATFSNPAYEIVSVTYSAVTPGGFDLSADLTIVQTHYAQSCEFELTNDNTTLQMNIENLIVTGRALSNGEDLKVEKESTATFWTQINRSGASFVRTISNDLVQEREQAEMLRDFTLGRQEVPQLCYRFTTPGNPERRLGDRITLYDSALMDAARDAFIISIDWSLTGLKYTQIITAVDVEGTYPYVDTSPGYFVIGASKLGAADPDRGRLFY